MNKECQRPCLSSNETKSDSNKNDINIKSEPENILEKSKPEEKSKLDENFSKSDSDKTRKRYKLRQPFKCLYDIWGVLTPVSFREKLYTYLFDNMEAYLIQKYDDPSIEVYRERITKRNFIERGKEVGAGLPEISCPQPGEDPKDKQVQQRIVKSIVENLMARRKHANKSTLILGLDDLFNEIWFEGYKTRKLEVPVFDDVIRALEKWQAAPFFIKHYTFASGPEENQRLFLKASKNGDKLNGLITSTFDTHKRYKYEVERYGTVVRCLGEREPSNLFYFTDSPTKARLASRKGITAFVVVREGNKKYKDELLEPFKVINSFDELEFIEADGKNCC